MSMKKQGARGKGQGARKEKYSCCHLVIFFLLLAFFGSACAGLSNPPRLATATALAALPPTATPEPVVIAAPTATAVSNPSSAAPTDLQPNPVLSVWVNETSAAHEAVLQKMVDDFTADNAIDVELMLVSPMLLPELVNTAVLSDTLPDIIIHPLEYTIGWAERGIFDVPLTTEIIDEIGRDTFNPDALALMKTPNGDAAIPSDGYQQLLIYRADWVQERGLNIPDNYDDMFAFAEAVFDLENNLTTGFIIPTESNLITTHQAFEQIAAANGCELIDEKGEVLILEPACQDALDFYFSIVNRFSPPGVQTDTSVRNAYLAGRTGMIMTSPDFLPQLAGLDAEAIPTCRECASNPAYLAENSGILTTLTGNNGVTTANFGTLRSLGITKEAERETAVLFADYWFNQGYAQWLAVDTQQKVPMRQGTAGQPRQFIDAWGTQPIVPNSPSLANLFGDELVAGLRENIATSARWGIEEGQGSLITQLYEELTLSIVLQEMLSGYFNSSQTLAEAYNRIVELIPNYQYLIDGAPPENSNG